MRAAKCVEEGQADAEDKLLRHGLPSFKISCYGLHEIAIWGAEADGRRVITIDVVTISAGIWRGAMIGAALGIASVVAGWMGLRALRRKVRAKLEAARPRVQHRLFVHRL